MRPRLQGQILFISDLFFHVVGSVSVLDAYNKNCRNQGKIFVMACGRKSFLGENLESFRILKVCHGWKQETLPQREHNLHTAVFFFIIFTVLLQEEISVMSCGIFQYKKKL
jgi:hypothetical protein